MQYLKADTVTEVLIGPVVAVGDGFTPVTSLTIAGADEAEIIKHGATTVTAITGTLAAITSADGYYALDLVTGDVDTEGRLTILINDDSLCLPVRHDFMVVNANVFDSLFAAATTDYLQVDDVQWLGTACAAPTVAGVPEVDLTHVAGVTTNVAALATNVDAILTDTAVIGAAGVGLTDLGGMSTTMKGQVQTECDDALVARDLDHLVNNGTAVPAVTVGTFIDQMMDDGTAVYDRTTDSLQAIRDTAPLGTVMRGTDSAALASVCTEARLSELDAATGGKMANQVDVIEVDTTANLDATVSSRATPAQVLTTALTESYAADGVAPTLAQVLFQIWSALGDFSISGTTITCKKLDGTTTSMTFTLDDGTNPTSRTRAT